MSRPIAEGIARAELRFGFMEEPNVPRELAEAHGERQAPKCDLDKTIYYTGHETIIPQADGRDCRAGERRSSPSCITTPRDPALISRFPAAQIMEIGVEFEI